MNNQQDTCVPPLPQNAARRQLLAGSAAAVAAVGLGAFSRSAVAQAAAPTAAKPLPPYVAWKDPAAMIVHTSSTLETRRSAFGTSVITPNDQLYIRNNLPAPGPEIVADRDAWEVAVEGVKSPRSFTVKELKSLGLETTAMVLQCSGNGRGYFPSKPSGTPWQVGAAGCVVWSGVPVRAVVEATGGLVDGMPYMTGTGGEKLPEGVDPKSVMVERSVPKDAMADALLAWEMNGAPIPLAHGGPLRLVVPGYNGVNNVKYIKRLAFTAKETDAKIMAHGYRMCAPRPEGRPQPAVDLGNGTQVVDQFAQRRHRPTAGWPGANQGRGLWWHERGARHRRLGGRRSDLGSRPPGGPRPRQVRLAAVCAGRQTARRHPHADEPGDRRAWQRADRAGAGEHRRLFQQQLA